MRTQTHTHNENICLKSFKGKETKHHRRLFCKIQIEYPGSEARQAAIYLMWHISGIYLEHQGNKQEALDRVARPCITYFFR